MAPGKSKGLPQMLRLKHPTLTTIFELDSETTENSFLALMDWTHGTPLSEWVGLVELYAADLAEMLRAWVGRGLARLYEIRHNEQDSPSNPTSLPMQGLSSPRSSR